MPSMAYISLSKPSQWRLRPSTPHSRRTILRLFCSTETPNPQIAPESDPNNGSAPETNPPPQIPKTEDSAAETAPPAQTSKPRQLRRIRSPEKPEDIICRMMDSRAWTTRLQNSIRDLVPEFDHHLVWNVLHGAKTSDQALQFFRWVERSRLFQHDRETHLKIIEILGRASKLNHARCILLDMPKKGVKWDEDLFIHLIDSYGKAGIVQESVKLFNQMKELGVERTLKSYEALFKSILRRGRYMMGKRYFNHMLAEGIEPTRHTYNIMIWGFFLSLRLETAKRFFEDMKSRGLSPDVVTYNTMVNGYNRFKMMDEAEQLFIELKGKNIEPNVISYTTLIKGYVSVGRVNDGLRLFIEMKSFGIKPNEVTFTTLLPGLCEAEKKDEALEILKEMVQRHIAPKDNSIFEKLLYCQCQSGDLDAAAYVLKAMIRLHIPTEAGHYGILIENFCKAGVYDRAVHLLDKLIEKNIVMSPQSSMELEASAYNPIIEYLCNHGQTGKAEVLFRQLMKKGVQDSVAFNNLICGHAKEGNSDSAFEILKIMGRRGVPREADSYRLLIKSYLSKGEPADAKTTLDNMIENGHVPESSLFRSVMESLFEDDRVQTASRVMKSMVEKGVNENMDLVAKVLEALFMRGHVEEALGRIDLLMQSGCAPEFDSLLSLLAEKKKTIAAVKLLDFCLERDCIIDFSSYEKVLDALLASGKTLNAYSILCKIVAKGGDTDWHSTKDLIKSLNLEGNTKQADVLSRMIKGGEEKASQRNKGKKQVGLHSKNVLTDRPIRTFCSIPVVNGYDDASSANPKEVDRVCKVIQELFALDRKMEAVLDDCGVELSHDLVVAILKRFSHARKPAFRFFCWAGERPGFEHDSTTYNSMMSILGKTRQFETMVSLLEEMGAKGTLTMETFVIAFRAFAAAKERKKAIGMFDLMKYYNFKYGVDTVNCLFDALGRAKLGKEMQLLFEKLKGRFTPNLQTYTVLLNGWCRVKNLMEAGQVWNEMIDKGFMPDVVTYNIMLEGLLRSHKRSDAIKLFELMKAKGPSPNVRSYSILIQNFCKQKQMKEAIDYLDEMRKAGCQPDVVVYTSLITGFGNQNKMNMVHGLLKAMKLDGCTPDEVTYNSLIKLMTRQRMPDDAAEIYKKMIQNGVEPSIHTYVMIMKSYFQMGNYTMGRAVWDEMIQKGCCPDDNSYTVLIGGLISQGRAGEACKFLDEMIEKGMKIPQLDFNKFAADFSRAGKPNLLEEMTQKMKFAGKFELSNVFAKWAEMTKIKVKGRDTNKTSGQGVYVTSHGSIHDNRS